MKKYSRRQFLESSAIAGIFAAGTFSQCNPAPPKRPISKEFRTHPLDGITREEIIITDIKVTLLSCKTPPEQQWIPSWEPPVYVWWKTDSILVEVYTDQGITGIGGSSRYGGDIENTKKYIDEIIRHSVTGKNPWDMDMYAYSGQDTLRRAAWAGVIAAFWDIIGKAVNKPVYKLLAIDNIPLTRVPVYASAGEVFANSIWPEDLIEEALRHKENGYHAFKFRTGIYWKYSNMTVRKFTTYLEKLRSAVGMDFGLVLEANGLFTLEQALEIAPAMEDLKFLWLEKPMNEEGVDSMENYRKIKGSLSSVRISGLEKEMKRDKIMDWLDQKVIDIVQPDCSIAGITESWYIARIAYTRGMQFCPHNYQCGFTTMQNAHLAAGNPNLLLLEICTCFDPLREEVFKEPLTLKNGYLELPGKPGFGIEVAENIEKKFPYIPGHYQKNRF